MNKPNLLRKISKLEKIFKENKDLFWTLRKFKSCIIDDNLVAASFYYGELTNIIVDTESTKYSEELRTLCPHLSTYLSIDVDVEKLFF